MKPGIYAGIPNAEYHGGEGISKSGLDLIHRSPMHYKFATSSANDNEPTASQALGTAFHALILEPEEFTKTYCLALRRQDVPDAIDDRDVLVGMIQEINASREAAFPDAIRDKEQLVIMIQALNANRKPKLITGGTKAEVIDRILTEQPEQTYTAEQLEVMKAPELKSIIERLNQDRAGLLSTNGSVNELAATLRANGVELTLWSEICEDGEKASGVPFIGSTSASRHDMAAWLRVNGKPVTLWSDVQAEWLANNSERIVLDEDTWSKLMAMRDAVMNHPAASGLLLRGQNVVVDLKTTDDASLEGFSKSIANWRYDIQHPYYLDGLREALRQGNCLPPKDGAAELSAYWYDQETGVLCRCRPDFWRGNPDHFAFIAVEKKPPFAVGVYVLDQESVALGRAQYRADLNLYAECQRTDTWPGYGDKVQVISTPKWHMNKNQHLMDAAE